VIEPSAIENQLHNGPIAQPPNFPGA